MMPFQTFLWGKRQDWQRLEFSAYDQVCDDQYFKPSGQEKAPDEISTVSKSSPTPLCRATPLLKIYDSSFAPK